MQRSFSQLSQNPYFYFLLGIFFSCIVIALVTGNSPSFDYRAIGISIIHGQDVSVRGKIQVFSVFSITCYFLALFLRIRVHPEPLSQNRTQTHHGAVLALILILNFLLFIYTDNPLFLNTAYALLYLTGLAIYAHRNTLDKYPSDFSWVIPALAYQLLITAYCIWGKVPQFDLPFFTLLTFLLLAAFTIADKLLREAYNPALMAMLSRCLWPLMLLPLSVIVANEVQYTLSTRYQLRLHGLWIWLAQFMCLFLIGLRIFLKDREHGNSFLSFEDSAREITRLLDTRYLPLVLMSSVAFSSYVIDFDFFHLRDVFHGGEAIVPMQQMLEYGAIPYIDFYPPHGLFDFFPQLFYQLINQTQYVESHLWGDGYMSGWLPRTITALAMYCFLGRYLSYKTAFLVIFALPTYHLIHPYYIALLLPAMMIGDEKKTFLQWMLFWSLVIAITLWRVDFGIATVVASFFVLIMWSWSERSEIMLIRGVSALGLICTATALIFSIFCIIKGHSPLYVFQQIMEYVAIITPVTSYEKFLGQLDSATFIQYLFFPLIAVVYAAYFSSCVIRHQPITKLHLVLAYLSVLSLVISVRSLHRHSHYEGAFSSYCYFLVLALVVLLLPKITKTMQVSLFLIICVAGYAFLPSPKSFFQAAYYNTLDIEAEYPAPASNRAPILLSEKEVPDNRLGPTKSKLDSTTFFLNNYLQGEQTFYDFTNSPLLYALAQKKIPSYIFETLFHTSDAVQGKVLADLEALYQRDEIPVVLFKQNLDALDNVDGVAAAIRSYRVAEYIYKRYQPCVSIDNYEIWISKNVVGTQDCAAYLRKTWRSYEALPGGSEIDFVSLEASTQFFEILKLPYIWANYDRIDPLQAASSQEAININSTEKSSNQFELQLPTKIQTDTGNYIHLKVTSEEDTRAELRYANGNGFAFSIIGNSQPLDYLIRVSSQYAWYEQPIRRMSLRADAPIKLEYARLLPGD